MKIRSLFTATLVFSLMMVAMVGISFASLTRVALLVRDSATIDVDEDNIQQFLITNSFSYDVVDASMIKNGTINLSDYNVLYMRTGAEPVTYNDPDVISKIRTRVESGGKLVFEYYGSYLGVYLGTGTIITAWWGPAAYDAIYFVEPISSSPIFNNICIWSPPVLPDNDNQLITKLSQRGGWAIIHFDFQNPQLVQYWFLSTTYGWPGQATGSEYCMQHPNLCTPERSIFESWDNIQFINLGQGSVYDLKLGLGYQTPANCLIFGQVADRMRRNVITNGAGYNLNDGLVAYWSFDNCDARDDSGIGHNGTIYGSPQCVDGIKVKALKFDGIDDFMQIPANVNLDNRDFTISAWFNQRGPGKDQNGGTVITRLWNGNNENSLADVVTFYTINYSVLEIYYNWDGQEPPADNEYFRLNADISNDLWYMAAITKVGTIMNIF